MDLKSKIEECLKSNNRPMTAKEIADKLISGHLWNTTAKSPDQSIGSIIYVDMDKNKESSTFTKIAPGLFGLKEWPDAVTCDSAKKTGLTFVESAYRVLSENSSRKPLHYNDITDIAINKGYLITSGLTPEATMAAQIRAENKRRQKRNEPVRFEFPSPGMVSLTAWTKSKFTGEIERHNERIKEELLRKLKAIDPEKFEIIISKLLSEMGLEEVGTTRYSNDGGIDVRGTLVVTKSIRIQLAVQVKRWKNNVQAPEVNKVRGSLSIHETGVIITTSGFSAGAVKEACKQTSVPIYLIDGKELASLMVEYEVGIEKERQTIYRINPTSLTDDQTGQSDQTI